MESAAKTIRTMLALVVALYSFFSCLAYFRQKPLLLLIVTAVIVADIVAQIIVSRKMKNRAGNSLSGQELLQVRQCLSSFSRLWASMVSAASGADCSIRLKKSLKSIPPSPSGA